MGKRTTWTVPEIRKVAAGCSSRKDFYENNRSAYAAAQRRGLLDELCADMDSQTVAIWNYDNVPLEAQKYKTRGAFSKGSPGAYNFAVRTKILEDVCKHMPKNINQTNRKWTPARLKEVASEYEDRKAFRKGNRSAYVTAHKMELIDDLFPA